MWANPRAPPPLNTRPTWGLLSFGRSRRRPQSASTKDGLGNSPAATAGMLEQALRATDRAQDATRLRETLERHGVTPTSARRRQR